MSRIGKKVIEIPAGAKAEQKKRRVLNKILYKKCSLFSLRFYKAVYKKRMCFLLRV